MPPRRRWRWGKRQLPVFFYFPAASCLGNSGQLRTAARKHFAPLPLARCLLIRGRRSSNTRNVGYSERRRLIVKGNSFRACLAERTVTRPRLYPPGQVPILWCPLFPLNVLTNQLHRSRKVKKRNAKNQLVGTMPISLSAQRTTVQMKTEIQRGETTLLYVGLAPTLWLTHVCRLNR